MAKAAMAGQAPRLGESGEVDLRSK